MKRENESLENFRSLYESRLKLAAEETKKIDEAVDARENFMKNYDILKSMKARKEATHTQLMEAARDDALAKVIKSVYITALEADTLTDNGIILADSMVDKWIKENGGASKILGAVGENTYLLSRITQIVEDAAEKDVAEVEEPDEDETPDENASKDVQIAQLNAQDAKIKAQIADIKAQKKEEEEAEKDSPADDAPETDSADEAPAEDKEPSDDDKDVGLDLDDEEDESSKSDNKEEAEESPKEEDKEKEAPTGSADESSEDDKELDLKLDDEPESDSEESNSDEKENDETPDEEVDDDVLAAVDDDDEYSDDEDDSDIELDNDIDDDGQDDDEEEAQEVDTTIDGDTENEGEIFDNLDKEEDIKRAIDLIRTRVADAEENFIRNNAEDKKRVDELINKISNNVKAVEDLNDKHDADTEKEIAQESIRMDKRMIDNIRDNRPLTVFEKMTRNLTSSIVTNESALESYTAEDGKLDVASVVESAKVMYAFLETLNTLQLANVDNKYIEDVLNSMK